MNASFIALPPILILSWISCPLSSPCRPMSPACKYSLQFPSCSNLLLFASRDCTVLCYAVLYTVLYCCARLHLRGQARRGHAPLHPRPSRAAAGGGAAGGRGQCRPLQPRTGRRGRGPTVRQPQGETVKIFYQKYLIVHKKYFPSGGHPLVHWLHRGWAEAVRPVQLHHQEGRAGAGGERALHCV